jgi:hypothetical protein
MMRRRFVRHPRRYAGHRPITLRNYNQLSTTVGVLPDNEHDLAATGMERVINLPLYQVLAGRMSLLKTPETRKMLGGTGDIDPADVLPPVKPG